MMLVARHPTIARGQRINIAPSELNRKVTKCKSTSWGSRRLLSFSHVALSLRLPSRSRRHSRSCSSNRSCSASYTASKPFARAAPKMIVIKMTMDTAAAVG